MEEKRRKGRDPDKPRPAHPRRQARQERATERMAARETRTYAEQLSLVVERRGKSNKEVNKLLKEIG